MKNYKVTVNGKVYEVSVEEVGASAAFVAPAAPVSAPVAPVAAPAVVETKPAPAAAPATNTQGEKVNSPMPGTILDVKVSVGQEVKKGEVLVVLEAMKMENDIPAPVDGKVVAVSVSKGSSVQAGDVIVVIG